MSKAEIKKKLLNRHHKQIEIKIMRIWKTLYFIITRKYNPTINFKSQQEQLQWAILNI